MILRALNQCDNCPGSIMPVTHTGRKSRFVLPQRTQNASGNCNLTMEYIADHFRCDSARTKDNRFTMAKIKHC